MGFGTRFNPASRSQLARMSIPPSGDSPEAIWHQFYDTQTYTDNATTTLTFFANPAADRTLTNMETGGQLSDPQYFSIYDVCCDFLTANTEATTAVPGELNDLSLLLKVGRPTWTFTLSDKNYGPYSLTTLHGTGGPVGGVSVGSIATTVSQWANNALGPGWNYKGSIIIPPKTSFRITVNWAAAQNLTADVKVRLSLYGILSRAVK
jgi:hypothetical protein